MPAVGTNPIFELVLEYDISGVPATQVLHYERVSLPDSGNGSQQLINAFLADVVPDWQALANDGVTLNTMKARRLNSVVDFVESPIGVSGSVVGDSCPSFTAFAMRLNRTTKETRSGAKRWPGVSEADTNPGGSALNAGAVNALTVLATSLAATISDAGQSFDVRIVGGKYDTTVSPPVLKPEADWIYNGVASITVKNRVTSQSSRKSI